MNARTPARYEQIANHLLGLIESGAPGDRLPSEAELCERFGVSRMTARQAMQMVAVDGLVVRRRGAGTFIREHAVQRELGSPLSFTDSMVARGMTSSSKTLEWERIDPSSDERLALGLAPEEAAYVLERLRLADGTPMAVERVVMSVHLAGQLLQGFQDGSLHDAFRSLGRTPSESHAEVSARLATKRQRELLGLTASGVVMTELKTIFDQDGDPLERTETCYAADRYKFRAILQATRVGP